jgi:hypothetical protein
VQVIPAIHSPQDIKQMMNRPRQEPLKTMNMDPLHPHIVRVEYEDNETQLLDDFAVSESSDRIPPSFRRAA